MNKNNNLVQIAQILIEMREERELHGVPASVMSRYPEGSQGIVINEDKYIVLNSADSCYSYNFGFGCCCGQN